MKLLRRTSPPHRRPSDHPASSHHLRRVEHAISNQRDSRDFIEDEKGERMVEGLSRRRCLKFRCEEMKLVEADNALEPSRTYSPRFFVDATARSSRCAIEHLSDSQACQTSIDG